MRGNAHVRFGGRPGETDRPKGRHRAPGPPNVFGHNRRRTPMAAFQTLLGLGAQAARTARRGGGESTAPPRAA